ncbi:arginyl-tRNA synthetase [Dethiosulfovibrio peptidovorans DSM 11002]|uniref:Arginine--tRNA ligase n=1 Tax=Dethiosulfovibrio peptidovorans DSM 11002 TaxID=469381 RepID=D2Z2Y1_9BACT|nr:arginine--tRNA ligase [Dethiosulfovibrio peptidovorans]EFC90199.1 arginyl-tRNA synthetase [Dethiosulfovibrio peptidovorans DSM 11002]
MADVTTILRDLIGEALSDMARQKEVSSDLLPEVHLERPKREDQGDWATNVAMQACKLLGEKPRDLAAMVVDRLKDDEHIRSVEVAGPGFINFFLADRWIGNVISSVLSSGDDYGRCDLGKGRKVQVEFVSANPTGPLHVGHGRGAAVGDIVGNILDFSGWKVEKEYYVNDAGLQMSNLGKSTQSRYFELLGQADKAPFPEDGYKGDYIYDLARQVIDDHGDEYLSVDLEESLPFFRDFSSKVILDGIKADLKRFGVTFDCWFSEKSLYENDQVLDTVEALRKRGYSYEEDGAIWFRSTDFGDDKDRVLFRSNGVPTYFASDVAYHKNKFDRGFDLAIDVWGADHHGYVPRMRAAVEALGKSPDDNFAVTLIQFVNLLRDGEQVSMSTRSGQFVTLSDVIDEVGVDATRFYFVMRRSDSHLDFDLELAKRESSDNPVFYVQYANARIASITRNLRDKGIAMPSVDELDESLISSSEEKKLITRLSMFPEEVEKAAVEMAPHRIVNYVHDLAGDFHSFYNAHRVLDENPSRPSRILLVKATHVVLTNALRILGISAPERM